MKKFIPYLIIAALAALLIFSVRGCAAREVREHVIIQAAEHAPDSGRIWRDAAGIEHRRAEAAAGDAQTIRIAYASLLDSVATLNEIRTKDVQEITWLSTELSGRHELPVSNTLASDGHTAVSFQYSDHWLRLYGTGSIRNDSLSDLWMDYKLRDSILVTTMRRRTGLFQKGTFVDVTSANPEVRVTGVHSIVIRDRPKPWGLGLQLGTTYSFTSGWQPYLGIGISYNLLRF